jgi:adenosylhomocysteine nucleosidase
MIVVVGLEFEARIAAGPGMRVICSGDGRNLASQLAGALSHDCRGLVSFGVAGGLAPHLRPGDCVVGSAVVSKTARHELDQEWSKKLLATIPSAVHGTLYGTSTPVADTRTKRALFEETGAMAVDMESHVVAEFGARHGLPVAAIRVITDPAVRALPEAALVAMRPNGTTDIPAMLRRLVTNPHELPALMRTALDARAARATLMRGRQLLGPGLGLPQFQAV